MSVSDLEKLRRLQTAITLLRGDLERYYTETVERCRKVTAKSLSGARELNCRADGLAWCMDRVDTIRRENNIAAAEEAAEQAYLDELHAWGCGRL